jgi:hypothetical protein
MFHEEIIIPSSLPKFNSVRQTRRNAELTKQKIRRANYVEIYRVNIGDKKLTVPIVILVTKITVVNEEQNCQFL